MAVIVPVYNAGKKLKVCIKSILKQNYENWVCILVDDGSTDGSDKICDRFAQKDNRIYVIHQKNKGSVEARKTGVLCKKAQENRYITFVDADDRLPADALKKMVTAIRNTEADIVCGKMIRKWKNISISGKFIPPCFAANRIQVFEKDDIINKLYISCFGISNLPVNLCGKLYNTQLISKAINFENIVKFMGEDLSVMLHVLPLCGRLTVLPENVYYYNVGGNTTRYMPYMLEDFLALYQYKEKMAVRYPMPYDVAKLMNIELVNIVRSYLLMCAKAGRYSAGQLDDEIQKIIKNPIIRKAAENAENVGLAEYIRKSQNDLIADNIWQTVKKDKWKDRLKRLLYSV
ncbi:glycosyltransferase family 2 protein [Mediterraneibacter glycyrrhizinilyticus]|uniref:glycosyltransferase family 2 protein n=1 Tax=Mediterraneibacter glycyrrhizinilyticus TaxID=342942 RepID=UPI002F402D52